MSLMIKDLKKLPEGTEISGFPLLIKIARGTFRDADENIWQEALFMDATGEITGQILLEPYETETEYKSHKTTGDAPFWQSKQRICVMKGTIQDADVRKKPTAKIVITECFDLAVRLTHSQQQDLQEEEWQQLRQDEIKGKIRHGLVCALIRAGQIEPDMKSGKEHIPKLAKAIINEIVDFIITGE